jgi:hypothetical protein
MNKIDNYSIDCFRNCPKFYYWRIKRGLTKPGDKKLAAEFGTAIHLGLETYYKGGLTQEARDLAFTKSLEYFTPFETEGDEKRTSQRLVVILDKYFTRYPSEPFEVIATEVGGAFELDSNWIYTTRLDLPVEWKTPRGVYIVDHKTTYDLGSLIARPHNQITGYIYNACEMWENVLGAILNGIGVYATDEVMDKSLPKVPSAVTGKPVYQKKEREFFMRIPTQRTTRELEEWKGETLWWLHQIEECEENNRWPKHSPDYCVKYKGRCIGLDLCNADPDTAERMIQSGLYVVQPWEAWKGAATDTEE